MAFLDWPWLEKLLWSDKLQLIIAGKPHPNDMRSIYCFSDIYQKSLKVPNLKVLVGYERNQSEMLKAGSDLWLFTSRRPREACSTSGMSAALNGSLNLACRDGWYEEFPKASKTQLIIGILRGLSKKPQACTIAIKKLGTRRPCWQSSMLKRISAATEC